ncbi:MAG TPA: UDP-N-acetylmuramoyl-L-alanine--D-glutamate ligase [Acidobacteriaceae bacterium]|nr:UDP-N-acetylmuramoyl-L-alanine--D-glutamate ligase [Acidobacteriaceae bacterium]
MELKNKRILVVGLGKSGVASAIFLRKQGAQVTVSDLRSAEALAAELPALLDAGVMVEAGGHGLLTFRRQDLIVVSPGVPLDTPELQQARNLGTIVIGELELASRFLRGKILAITGSNGKTTTTALCGEIFRAGGQPTQVGGNIGVPVIALVPESTDNGWNVLEVSSFQLEAIVDFRPKIAVILNITPDHLDRHGNLENYIAAKKRIFVNQTGEDFLVLNAENPETQHAAADTNAQVFWTSMRRPVRQGTFVYQNSIVWRANEQAVLEPIMPLNEIALKGNHNVENVLAAVCAAKLAGISAEVIRNAVAAFRAVEHRLEFVARIHGVDFYNDSKATNVDATIKAVSAFPGGIHLILGGKDKDSDYTLLKPLLQERVRAVYTIGAAAEKIEQQIAGATQIVSSKTLDRAVEAATAQARAGEVVLLAPACSSFDQFENYEHRGRCFKQIVLARQGVEEWQNASA